MLLLIKIRAQIIDVDIKFMQNSEGLSGPCFYLCSAVIDSHPKSQEANKLAHIGETTL